MPHRAMRAGRGSACLLLSSQKDLHRERWSTLTTIGRTPGFFPWGKGLPAAVIRGKLGSSAAEQRGTGEQGLIMTDTDSITREQAAAVALESIIYTRYIVEEES